jgi:hypothetical protein
MEDTSPPQGRLRPCVLGAVKGSIGHSAEFLVQARQLLSDSMN